MRAIGGCRRLGRICVEHVRDLSGASAFEEAVHERVELGGVVVEVVGDALERACESVVGRNEFAFGGLDVVEGVVDEADGGVGVASGIEEGDGHLATRERITVRFVGGARKEDKGAESAAGFVTGAVGEGGHDGGIGTVGLFGVVGMLETVGLLIC